MNTSTPDLDYATREALPVVRDVWCPGNGTRYELFITRPATGDAMFVWLNASPGPGRAMAVHPDGEIDAPYLMEKLAIHSEADAAALLLWLRRVGFTVYLPAGYDPQTARYTGRH